MPSAEADIRLIARQRPARSEGSGGKPTFNAVSPNLCHPLQCGHLLLSRRYRKTGIRILNMYSWISKSNQETARLECDMVNWVLKHWREFLRSLLWAFGAIFLPLEAYEVLKNGDITLSLPGFLAVALIPGAVVFFVDGYLIGGFLRREVTIPNPTNDTKIRVKFGNIFEEEGWKAIGANDFFDSIVDEDLISSKSLHGHVLSTYWHDDRENWKSQITASLRDAQGTIESRSRGNRIRYPIGTTARACTADQKFLFVALGKTNPANNVTSATAETLIKAVRGMAAEARAACSMEPLSIPLMGSGLSRVGIKNSALVDLIITAVLEEGRHGRITGEINIVLPEAKAHEINLKNHVRNWTDGQ